jgi:hypothetical protein
VGKIHTFSIYDRYAGATGQKSLSHPKWTPYNITAHWHNTTRHNLISLKKKKIVRHPAHVSPPRFFVESPPETNRYALRGSGVWERSQWMHWNGYMLASIDTLEGMSKTLKRLCLVAHSNGTVEWVQRYATQAVCSSVPCLLLCVCVLFPMMPAAGETADGGGASTWIEIIPIKILHRACVWCGMVWGCSWHHVAAASTRGAFLLDNTPPASQTHRHGQLDVSLNTGIATAYLMIAINRDSRILVLVLPFRIECLMVVFHY